MIGILGKEKRYEDIILVQYVYLQERHLAFVLVDLFLTIFLKGHLFTYIF